MTAIIGASGSGKTTLLQILGTLDQPSGGELFYREQPLLKKSPKELAGVSQHFGWLHLPVSSPAARFHHPGKCDDAGTD